MGYLIAALCLIILIYLTVTNRIFTSRGKKDDSDGVPVYSYIFETEMDTQRCIDRLKRTGDNEIFEYEFDKDEDAGTYTMTFIAVKRYYNPCGHCTYIVSFEEMEDGGTLIKMRLKGTGDKMFSKAFDIEMDEFMDAVISGRQRPLV